MKEVLWHIWPGSVFFILNDADLKKAKRKLSSHVYLDLEEMGGDGLTLSWGTTSVIRLKTKDMATVAHECLHAVNHMLDVVGISLQRETDEAYAYSLQYLIREYKKLI